jgi:hypothetical protein
MKHAFLSLLTCALLFSEGSFGQRYVNLSVDNDLYFDLDRYYSSGIFVSFGKLKSIDQKEFFPKKFTHWTLGQEIYTPKNRYTRNIRDLDYPYGGWLFLERSFEWYKSTLSAWGLSLKIGMTGKASLAPYFQNLYHDKVLGLRDLAWVKALPQRFHLNVNTLKKRRWPLGERLALLSEFFGNLGTQRIAAGGRFGVLWGTSEALGFLGNPLEMQSKGYGFYIGTLQAYRFHDYMISGSLFDNDAPFVLTDIPYKNSLELGFAYHTEKWRFLTLWNSISSDNRLQLNPRHYYLNISVGRFF